MSGAIAPSPPVVRRRPRQGWAALDLAELWRHRGLLGFFAARQVKTRYKQTLLGAGWALLQPALTALIFTLFLGRLAGVPSDGVPYALFALTGLLPWQIFAFALNQASHSLLEDDRLLTKVAFPRLLVPVAAVLAGLVDFAVAGLLLLAALLWFAVWPGAAALASLGFVLLALLAALGVGLWLSALNVYYRDVRYTLPFLSQLWLLATPVAYPTSLVPEAWRTLYGLNPMVAVVEGFRWAWLGTPAPSPALIAVSTAATAVLLASGLLVFRRLERDFADVV